MTQKLKKKNYEKYLFLKNSSWVIDKQCFNLIFKKFFII